MTDDQYESLLQEITQLAAHVDHIARLTLKNPDLVRPAGTPTLEARLDRIEQELQKLRR